MHKDLWSEIKSIFKMNFLPKILALLLTLQVVYSQHLAENEEQRKIQEYISYVESNRYTAVTDILTLSRRACEEIVKEVPVGVRGELTAALKKFVEDAVIAERGTDYNAKREVLDSLEVIIKDKFQRDVTPSPELTLVITKLTPAALAAKQIDDDRTEKFITASNNLKSLFSPNGISRNHRLFEKIRSFENADDDKARDQIVNDILAYKA